MVSTLSTEKCAIIAHVDSMGLMTNTENLAEYFTKRWFNKPSAREICFVNEILESSFGQNGLYFINKTDELIDMKIKHNKKISPSVLDEFKITGDAEEDGVIAHAGMIWSLLNGEPWPEAVYHDYVDRLVKGRSELTAYVAARLWPARGLIEKVQYRPLSYITDTEKLMNEYYKYILTRFDKQYCLFAEPCSIPHFLKYRDDFSIILNKIPKQYLEKFGFSHPMLALVNVHEIDNLFTEKVREILEKDSFPDEMYEALLFLYLHLELYIKMSKEFKKEVSSFLLDLRENLDIFIKNKIKKCAEIELKTKEILSIEPSAFKKFINQFLAMYNILTIEIGKFYILNSFKEEFCQKIVRAILKLSEDGEDIFENIDFIDENLIEIIECMKQEEKIKIEKYIKKRLDKNKTKELLLKLKLFNMFSDLINFYEDHIKEMCKILSIKEIINILIKNISDINKDFKIKILKKIMEKEFGKSNLKKDKIEEDLYLIIRGGLYNFNFKKTRKYGLILYSEMMERYIRFHIEESEDPYINTCKEILNKMHLIFNEQNHGCIFYNIIYTLERIYFGNFINREEEIRSINLLLENIKANTGYIYENLSKDRDLLINIRKRFILNIEKLIEHKNIDEIMNILMIQKNCNIYLV